MKKQIIYLLLLVGFVGFSQESPVSFSATTNKIKIGEQIEYKITVKSKGTIGFPTFEADSLKKIDISEVLPTDTLKNSYEKTYLLTSFDTGRFVIPEQSVIIDKKVFKTKSFLVDVTGVAVDTLKQKMFEIKSVKSEPKTFDDYKHFMWWILALIVLLGIGLYFILRKKKEKEKLIVLKPIQEAFQRLKELDEKQLVQQNKVKIYYSELTDIVRTYIEKDINIPALESTTNDLIETINDFNESSKLGISKETIAQLKMVLQSADLVKFAKSKPMVEEIKNDRNIIEIILKNTETAVHKNDVVEEIAVATVAEMKETSKPKKKKKKLLKYGLLIGAALVLVFGILGYLYVKKNVLGSSTSEMLEKQWSTGSYGTPEITLETPEILQKTNIEIPQSVVSVVGDLSVFIYGSLISDFYIGVTSTQFLNQLESYDIDAGVNGSLHEMENSLGTIFTKKLEEPITLNGIEGRKVIVEYQRKSLLTTKLTDYELTMLFFADAKGLRQVIVSNLKEDESANKICNKIMNSVSLNP